MYKSRIKDISQYNDIADCIKIWQCILMYLSSIAGNITFNISQFIRLGNVFNKTSLRSL